MILTFRTFSGFDRPIMIEYLGTFINSVFDDARLLHYVRLYDNDGHLIGRSATYKGV